MRLKNRIQELMTERGISEPTPLKRAQMGFTRKSWPMVLRNELDLSVTQLYAVAAWLGVPASSLLEQEGGMAA